METQLSNHRLNRYESHHLRTQNHLNAKASNANRASNCRYKAKHGGFDANKTNALINSAEAREKSAQILEDHLREFDELKKGNIRI